MTEHILLVLFYNRKCETFTITLYPIVGWIICNSLRKKQNCVHELKFINGKL